MTKTITAAALAVLLLQGCAGRGPSAAGEYRTSNPALYEAYRGLDGFGAPDAWSMGYDGRGVNVAVMDSGIDFGAADLYGSQARVRTPGSPYDGWPIVVDIISLEQYQAKRPSGQTWYCDTSSTDLKDCVPTGTSRSGVYHVGEHPDRNLTTYYGRPVMVLVADERTAGRYDTVYVDLNNNRDFTDDKPCRKGDEIAVWDRNGDGYWDETGGLIYFIADGETPLPFSRLLYGDEARLPENGALVAFHYEMSSHGTMCAGTIGARGRRVWGLAPGASLIPVVAYGSNDVTLAMLTAVGYDGKPGTGDEANVISRSAGFDHVQKGVDEVSAAMEYLASQALPKTALVYAAGNAGSGYGTQGSPASMSVITAGAIQDLWFQGSPHRGDVVCFSSRGPDAFGRLKPNVLATGLFAPEVVPLNRAHDGLSSWDGNGGGTSDATPHTAGVVALIYQAYKDAHGEFPDAATARDILMSGATDINDEVLAQGAGIINAGRSVRIASRRGSVLFRPAYFATPPVEAGSAVDFRFEVENYSRKPVTYKPQRLVRKSRRSFIIPAADDELLMTLPADALQGDLVKVCSYSAKDPVARKMEDSVGHIVYLYNWTDVDKDGAYGPAGRVRLEDTQPGELVALSMSDWDHVITSEARLHDPAARITDGLVLGLKKECEFMPRHAKMTARDVTIVVEAFAWVDWPALSVSADGRGAACTLRVPETTGVYQGRIQVQVEGEPVQTFPVSLAAYRDGEIKLADGDDIYENARLYSRFEGSGRMGLRDARVYPVQHRGDGLVRIRVTWEDPASDVDVSVFGPASADLAKTWTYPQPPPVPLPVVPAYEDNGHSLKRIREVPCYPLGPATGKSVVGRFRDGLNVVVLNMINSGQTTYGENVTVTLEPLGEAAAGPVALEAEAGSPAALALPAADAVTAFAEGVQVSGPEHVFTARRGDVAILHPEGPYFYTTLYFDANGNGKPDEYEDQIVFSAATRALTAALGDEVVPLPFDGRYIFTSFTGWFHHARETVRCAGPGLTMTAPTRAGVYRSAALRNGDFLPGLIELTVKPSAASRVAVDVETDVRDRRPFEVRLRAADRFGNTVAGDESVSVEFEGGTHEVALAKGEGKLALTAPGRPGTAGLTVRSRFGTERVAVRVDRGPAVEIGSAAVRDGAVALKLRNWTDREQAVSVYANPSFYATPDLARHPGLATMGPLADKGYVGGYLALSASRGVTLAPDEEKDLVLDIPGLKERGSAAAGIPYLVAVTDAETRLIHQRETFSFRVPSAWLTTDPTKLADLSSLGAAVAGEYVVFKAAGTVIFRLNDRPPLFLVPTVAGMMALKIDEPGRLSVRAGTAARSITVAPRPGPAAAAGDAAADKTPPAKIEGVTLTTDGATVRISWPPSAEKDIHHYAVYRWGRSGQKIGEPETPTHEFKGRPWNVYVFRVAAVDAAGNEGPLSDPAAIVTAPPEKDRG